MTRVGVQHIVSVLMLQGVGANMTWLADTCQAEQTDMSASPTCHLCERRQTAGRGMDRETGRGMDTQTQTWQHY